MRQLGERNDLVVGASEVIS